MIERIHIGDLVSPHGIKGEVNLYVIADSPDFALQFERFFVDDTEIRVVDSRIHKNVVILRLEGVDSRNKAEELVGKSLFFERNDAELDEGQYFIVDIIGFAVVDIDSGEHYGNIEKVDNFGSTDIYHIKNDKGQIFLFPAAPAFVKERDFEAKVIKISPIKGMFDDEAEEIS